MSNHSLTLRRVLLPQQETNAPAELYFRGQGRVENGTRPQLHISGTAAFDTYFNALPLARYQEYDRLSELSLRLKVSGILVLRIFGVFRSEEGTYREECLLKKLLKAEEATEMVTDLGEILPQKPAMMYFTLEAQEGVLYDGRFEAKATELYDTDIAVVICTFRREEFLLRNYHSVVRWLDGQSELGGGNIHFFIVDNGRTLSAEELSHPCFTLIPNENTGGSGGFTRGYYEALHSKRHFSHILLMDDDIVLDGEMLLRVYSLLRLRKPECAELAVGGTMLRLSDRVTQHEAGALWDGKRLTSIGTDVNMTDRQAVFDTAFYPQADYNAWWFYCFPANWADRYGYPLPFFVKEDDIEYSLRCAGQIAVLNGIAVWHDDFHGKYDGFQEYYIKRNELILTSVNRQKPYALFQIRKLILSVMKQTVYQRYFLADLIFRAYDDYLRGWRHFYRTDTAALNQELMNACLPLLDDNTLREQYGVYFDEDKYQTALTEPENLKKQALSLNGYLLPARRDKDGFVMTDLAGCRIVNFYRHKKVLHYDAKRRKGFVTVQKRRMLWWNLLRLCGKSVKFLVMYPFVRRGYRRHLRELSEYPGTKRSI